MQPCTQDAQDILSALAGEAGFETFEETATGLKGYVQQALFDEEVLQQVLEGFPFENVALTYSIQEAEDKDWNEQWEQEGFEPISLPLPPSKRKGNLIIHDGRHPHDLQHIIRNGISRHARTRLRLWYGYFRHLCPEGRCSECGML